MRHRRERLAVSVAQYPGAVAWHNIVARDVAVERRHDTLLATIGEQVPEIRPLQSDDREPIAAASGLHGADAKIAGTLKS